MTNPDDRTKYILIYNPYGENDRVERFITQKELEVFINENQLGTDPEAYQVTLLKIEYHVSLIPQTNAKEESVRNQP
jgi:hypothetical protein